MKNTTFHAAARMVTVLLTFSVVAALLVKAGGLSLQAMFAWQVLLTVVGALSVLVTRSGGGGGPGRPILAYAPVRRR